MRRDPDADAATADLPQRTVVSAVDVRTIFEAKGLSAEHVIVLGCDDENLKRTSRSAFFVALTRARDSLTLLACMQGGGPTALHQFICSLPDDHTDAVYARAESVQPFATIAELQEHLAKVDYWRAKQKTTSKS
jgi:superfamily I DNA/RNA helicase